MSHDKYTVTATSEVGIHTGRTRFHVQCNACGRILHEATTGPEWQQKVHERDGCEPHVDFLGAGSTSGR